MHLWKDILPIAMLIGIFTLLIAALLMYFWVLPEISNQFLVVLYVLFTAIALFVLMLREEWKRRST